VRPRQLFGLSAGPDWDDQASRRTQWPKGANGLSQSLTSSSADAKHKPKIQGARSELASAAATGGGGPQAPPTRITSRLRAAVPPACAGWTRVRRGWPPPVHGSLVQIAGRQSSISVQAAAAGGHDTSRLPVASSWPLPELRPSRSIWMRSMGSGKTMVLFFSAAISVNVCRYRSCNVAG
jgi:hypothetical protein